MERPDTGRLWQTKQGELLKLSEMDYNHLKNCKKMLYRGGKSYLPMYLYLCEEIDYREWERKHSKDTESTSRFELLDFD